VRRIHDFAGGRNPRPLFLQLSLTHPHDPFLCRQEYWDLFEGVDIPLPTVPPRTPEEHDPYSRRLLEQFGLLHAEFSEEEIRRARRAYYGSVAYVDAMFGRVMRALQETGLEEKTVVILTSDHGEMLGERGMWFKKTFFEPSIKVPLMISLPGGAGASGNEISVNVSLIDLLPTLAELGGSEVQPLEHEGFDGRSLVPLLEPSAGGAGRTEQLPGAVETFADRPVFAEYLGENAGAPVLMAKKGDYKYIYNRTDPEQLYDLATDPNETANLLAPEGTRPGAAPEEVRAELRSILDATWDEAALDRDVRLSQRRRMLIRDALKNGKPPDWTTDRSEDDSNRWYRGKQGYNEWAFDYL
jgi:choline-sulfatase